MDNGEGNDQNAIWGLGQSIIHWWCIVCISMGKSWSELLAYTYAAITSTYVISLFIESEFVPEIKITTYLGIIGYLAMCVVIYSIIERALKEMWVILDSNK